ncbi:VCBS repeat-containing protein [Streptomyces toyocaensis]|nr:VCBS repeat-containing protein [Streptomyces toyocaensis]
MVGKRLGMIGGGAAVAAVSVVAGTLLAGGESGSIAAPHACRTAAHGAAPQTGPAADRPVRTGAAPAADFDGDGHPDIALAGPAGDVGDSALAGIVAVAYGTSTGTDLGRCQRLTQGDPLIPGKPRGEAFFGFDTVARDFDEDGYTDLAASVFEGCDPHVIIMWGSERGLTRAARVPGTDGSHVPWATEPCLDEQLAAGDFDGDGHADLVFGLGSERGLLKGPFLRDGSPAGTGRVPVPRAPDERADDMAYQELVAGDLNGDGIDDLVTFHNDDTGPETVAWSELHWPVSYLQGGRDGFTQPDTVRLPDAAAGAVGDVDGDGFGDLVLSPRGGGVSRSSVTVVHGTESGPGTRTTTLDRDTPGVPGEEPGDEDGVFVALDTGDVNGDGYADVVAGAPRAEVYAEPGPEEVLFFPGGKNGLTGRGARAFDERDVHGFANSGHNFGRAARLTDMDGDHRADLVVTAPGNWEAPGSAWMLPGSAAGPLPQGITQLHEGTFVGPGEWADLGSGIAR